MLPALQNPLIMELPILNRADPIPTTTIYNILHTFMSANSLMNLSKIKNIIKTNIHYLDA